MNILIFSGIVMAVTEVIKLALGVTGRYIPLVALLVGVAFFTLAYITGEVALDYNSIVSALVSVLTALGLYSGVKNTAGL